MDKLLSKKNINQKKLEDFSKHILQIVTEGELGERDFALNHHGKKDVALFDFTSMYLATNACMVRERCGKKLVMAIVGDTLMEVMLSSKK